MAQRKQISDFKGARQVMAMGSFNQVNQLS